MISKGSRVMSVLFVLLKMHRDVNLEWLVKVSSFLFKSNPASVNRYFHITFTSESSNYQVADLLM